MTDRSRKPIMQKFITGSEADGLTPVPLVLGMSAKLLTLKEGEKLQDISIVIPDGDDSEAAQPVASGEDPTDESAEDDGSDAGDVAET